MPYSLYWTVIATLPLPPCAIGIGYSPPARKLASLPLSATRFGSARLWKSPFVWSALTTAPMSYLLLNRNTFRKSLNVIFPVADVTSLPQLELALVTARSENDGGENCWVLVLTMLFLMPNGAVRRLTPSSVIALRDTSANRTRSSTWLLGAPSRIWSSVSTSSFLST